MAFRNLNKKKKLGYALLAAAVLFLVVASALKILVFKGGAQMYSGKVLSSSGTGLVIEDARRGTVSVATSEDTRIMKGTHRIESVPGSGYVLVVGVPSDGEVRAKLVRVFNHKR